LLKSDLWKFITLARTFGAGKDPSENIMREPAHVPLDHYAEGRRATHRGDQRGILAGDIQQPSTESPRREEYSCRARLEPARSG